MSNKVSPLLPGSENAAEDQAQKKHERLAAMRRKKKMQEASKKAAADARIARVQMTTEAKMSKSRSSSPKLSIVTSVFLEHLRI